MNRTVSIISMILCLVSTCMSKSSLNELSTRMSQCGINSLCSCIYYLGIDYKLDQVYNDIEQDEKNEVNLYQLKDYAARFGVAVKPVRRPTLRDIRKHLMSNSCAILQFKYADHQPHIVALLCPKDKEIIVCDYPRKKYAISERKLSDYLSHSQGMLLLSSTPFQNTMFSRLIHSQFLWLCLFIVSLGALTVTIGSVIKKGRNRTV